MSGADRRRRRAVQERVARTGETYAEAERSYGEHTETPAVVKPASALDLPFVAPPDQPE